jgi:hypothetical protein
MGQEPAVNGASPKTPKLSARKMSEAEGELVKQDPGYMHVGLQVSGVV